MSHTFLLNLWIDGHNILQIYWKSDWGAHQFRSGPGAARAQQPETSRLGRLPKLGGTKLSCKLSFKFNIIYHYSRVT